MGTFPDNATFDFSFGMISFLTMSQEKIWAYYQNEGIECFKGARSRHDYLIKYVSRFRPASLLNIGCGDGYLELQAARRGWKTLSLDPDHRAMARLANLGVEAHVGSIEQIPLANEFADVVICSEVLEHLKPDQLVRGLAEIKRVLKPGGLLIGTTPFREDLKENSFVCQHCGEMSHIWGHEQTFDQYRMRSLLVQSGFEVKESRPVYFPIWDTNWKGKLVNAAVLALAVFGSHGRGSNLFFAAISPTPLL